MRDAIFIFLLRIIATAVIVSGLTIFIDIDAYPERMAHKIVTQCGMVIAGCLIIAVWLPMNKKK